MSVALRCVLEQLLVGLPQLEGKCLAVAYLGDPSMAGNSGIGSDEDPAGGEDPVHPTSVDPGRNVIAVDFGGTSVPPGPLPVAPDSLINRLDRFIPDHQNVAWHEAADGLEVVRQILARLNEGVEIRIDPEFEFAQAWDDDDLTEGVRGDLETLEQILELARSSEVRFHLTFDC